MAEVLRRHEARGLLHADDETNPNDANGSSSQRPRILFLRDEIGGRLYLISNGKMRTLKTSPEIANELDKYFGNMESGPDKVDSDALYLPLRTVRVKDGRVLKGELVHEKPIEYAAFQTRLNEIIKSSDVSRKAPGWRDFVRGLREVVQQGV